MKNINSNQQVEVNSNSKPKLSDYEDKKQYHREYNKWRRKYDDDFREKQKAYKREYNKWKSKNDPEYLIKKNASSYKSQLKRYRNDPEFRNMMINAQYNDTYTVYKITNSINDVVYIGSTKLKLKNRLTQHKQSAFKEMSNSDFYQFVRSVCSKKTFYDVFKIEHIETGIVDKADAWKLEGEYIRTAGDKVFNQYSNTSKNIKSRRKCSYNDYYTVYEITNLYNDTVYVGVSLQKLNIILKNHRNYAFNRQDKTEFHRFIRSASSHLNFNIVFSIKALQSNIPDADMASEIKEQILQDYAEKGKPTFNNRFIRKQNLQF